MRKAVLKRIKFTATGKLLRRQSGHNHFNAKEQRRFQLHHKTMTGFTKASGKKMKAYL